MNASKKSNSFQVKIKPKIYDNEMEKKMVRRIQTIGRISHFDARTYTTLYTWSGATHYQIFVRILDKNSGGHFLRYFPVIWTYLLD
jgi:hypothetical protein